MSHPANLRNRVASVSWFMIVLGVMYWSRFSMAQQDSSKPTSPDELIEYFSSLRHGLIERTMGEEAKAWLHDIIDHPELYAEAISKPLKVNLTHQSAPRRIGTALELARRSGRHDLFGAHVRELLPRLTGELHRARVRMKTQTPIVDENLWRDYQHILGLRNAVIDVLGDYGDSTAVETCLQGLTEEREYMSGADVVMFRYLEKVAPLRPDIRPKLEEMYNSPESPLRNNPQLLRVLEAIDKAAAERRMERPREKKGQPEPRDDE